MWFYFDSEVQVPYVEGEF